MRIFSNCEYSKAKAFKDKVDTAVTEIQDNLNPKALDYELNEKLKKRDVLTLVFKKYCDTIKYRMF